MLVWKVLAEMKNVAHVRMYVRLGKLDVKSETDNDWIDDKRAEICIIANIKKHVTELPS